MKKIYMLLGVMLFLSWSNNLFSQCDDVSDLTIDGVTLNSADISWTPGGTETDWNIEYGVSGFTPGSGTMGTATGTPDFTAPALTANTEYEFYVQADCGGGDESGWFGPITVFTGYCEFVATETDYFINNFSTTGGISNISNLASGYSPNGYQDGTSMIVSNFAGSPAINFTVNFGIETWYTFGFGIWVDWNNDLVFDSGEQLFQSSGYESSFSGSFSIPLGTPVGNYRMRIMADYNTSQPYDPCSLAFGQGEAEDFTLEVTTPPSCLPVADITFEGTTGTSADISWTVQGTETDWNIEYGLEGFTPGSGTMGTATGTPEFTATPLIAETYYDVYVQADCGGGDESMWVGPYTIYTGYCEFQGNDSYYAIESFSTIGGTGNNISNLGSGYGPNGYEDATAMIVSSFDGGPDINFQVDLNTYLAFSIWVDWNNNLMFESSEQMYSSGMFEESFTGSFSVPSGTAPGTYRMRILSDYNNSSADNPCSVEDGSGEVEDYTFEVTPVPSCLPVTDLTLVTTTLTSADISWTPLGTETDWNIEYGPQGFTPGSGTAGTASGTPEFSATPLTASTYYDIYVQADCGGGDESTWAGPITIYTGFCEVEALSTEYYINNFSTTGGVSSNISNLNSGIGPNGYTDATAMTVSSFEGGPDVNFTMNFGLEDYYTFGAGVWVDWNNNMVFEASEQMFQSVFYEDNFSGSFSVPMGTAVGSYRMRVLGDYYNSAPDNACYLETPDQYGEAEDYTFVVVPIPTCLPITDLEVDGETTTSIDISWTPGDTETNWNIEWGTPGFIPGTGAGVDSAQQSSSASFTVGGLNPSTVYDIYVQASCSSTDSSYWTLVSGTTLCAPITALPWTEDFDAMTEVDYNLFPLCWLAENGEWMSDDSDNSNGVPNSGPNFAAIWGGTQDFLWTPEFQLIAGKNYEFSFMWAGDGNTGWTGTAHVNGVQSSTGSDELGDFVTTTVTTTSDYQKATFCFVPLTSGVYTFGVEVSSGSWMNQNITLDDFSVIERANSAGISGTANVCQTTGLVELNDLITINDPYGSWVFTPNQVAIVNDTMFNPQFVLAGTVSVDYITTGCLEDTASALITIYPASNAGVDGAITACKNEPIDLVSGLTGTVNMGGDWYNPSNTMMPNSQIITGSTQASFNYQYIVGNGVCPDDTSMVVVNVITTCDWLSVDENEFESVNLYPNPSTGLVYIESTLSTSSFHLVITDVNGRVVKTGNNSITNGLNTVDLNDVQRGTYFFKLSNESAEKVYRVVIQ
jgi:hypothetical protein